VGGGGMTNEKGFTISELMVAVMLSSIAAAVIFTNFGFMHKTAARWKNNTAYEQDIALLVQRLQKKVASITEIDSISRSGIWFRDRNGLTSEIILAENWLKRFDSTFLWDKIQFDSGQIASYSTMLENDKNMDYVIDLQEVDENLDGKISGKETHSVDFVDFSLAFTCGINKYFSTSFLKRMSRNGRNLDVVK
jgi:prepilin-type N-terminal cleavage/methylation domain-containing protein